MCSSSHPSRGSNGNRQTTTPQPNPSVQEFQIFFAAMAVYCDKRVIKVKLGDIAVKNVIALIEEMPLSGLQYKACA